MTNSYIQHLFNKIKTKTVELSSIVQMMNAYSNELVDLIKNYISPYTMDDIFPNIINNNNTIEEQNDDKITIIDDIKIKELYKKLSLKLHPDKDNTPDDGDYINIREAYNDGDYYVLIKYSHNNDIELDIDDNQLLLILETKLYKLKDAIKKKKDTIGFQMLTARKCKVLDDILKLKKENDNIQKVIDDQLKENGKELNILKEKINTMKSKNN